MTTHDTTGAYTDGNALAGPLSGLFAVDLTAVVAVCGSCGRADRVATARVYGAPMGVVARCAGCAEILLRYAETSSGRSLDLRGVAVLRLPPAGEPE
jgi:hypothetical protein